MSEKVMIKEKTVVDNFFINMADLVTQGKFETIKDKLTNTFVEESSSPIVESSTQALIDASIEFRDTIDKNFQLENQRDLPGRYYGSTWYLKNIASALCNGQDAHPETIKAVNSAAKFTNEYKY